MNQTDTLTVDAPTDNPGDLEIHLQCPRALLEEPALCGWVPPPDTEMLPHGSRSTCVVCLDLARAACPHCHGSHMAW